MRMWERINQAVLAGLAAAVLLAEIKSNKTGQNK
jgi:hypothetical protein